MTIALALVAALVVPFCVALLRWGIVRRLASRNATRRPLETILVVIGSLFGAAMITGSLVVADTLDWSIRRVAYTHLGPIDEVVSTRDPAVLPELVAAAETLLANGTVDGILGIEISPVTLSTPGANRPRVLAGAQAVETDLDAAATFGGATGGSGLSGPGPTPSEAVVNRDVADALGLERGDALTVHIFGEQRTFSVARVVATEGVAGFRGTNSAATRSRNVFLSPGTVDQLLLEAVESSGLGGIAPPERIVALSNPGGVADGAGHTRDVTEAMERALGPDAPPVVPLKEDVLATASETSSQLGDLFAAMGAFGTLAGVLLLVNLFVMLAEERRSELGTMRALGMTRSLVVAGFAAEGWLYAVAASLLGTAAGVGLGRVIVAFVAAAIERLGDDLGLQLAFSVNGSSIAVGFAAGLGISVATVAAASVRAARLNVIRAIRDLPEPPRPPRRAVLLVSVVSLAGSAWSVWAIAAEEPYGTLLGPIAVVGALGAGLATERHRAAWAVPVASVIAIGWATLALRESLDRMSTDPDVNLFVVQGIVLTGAAVALLAQEQGLIVRVIARATRGRRWLPVRIGLAHPNARRLRTSLTVAMYALVVFTMTFVTVLSAVFGDELRDATDRLSGRFDVVTRWPASSLGALEALRSTDGVTSVAPLATTPVTVQPDGDRRAAAWLLSGFDERFVEGGPPELADRGAYGDDLEAYSSVLRDPGLAIVDPIFSQLHAEATGTPLTVGTPFSVIDPLSGRTHLFRVAATANADLALNGALAGVDALAQLTGVAPTENRAYVAVAGDDPSATAATIMSRNISLGIEAQAIGDIVSETAAIENQFFQLARGYLGLGLVVGVAGVGVVMVRAVRDRRREIGVLRSLGFRGGEVGTTLLVEATYVSVVGATVGSLLAVLTAYNVVTGTDLLGRAIAFTVPTAEILLLAAFTVAVSLVATILPARAATRVRPAVALRMAD